MKPAMYLFVNKGLGMSTGKTGAQVAHAAVEAFQISDSEIVDQWYVGGHYAKYVMECRDTEHLLLTQTYLEARGFRTILIIDEGHTEVPPISATALGVEIVDKDNPHTAASFETHRTYKDRKSSPPPKKPKWQLRHLWDWRYMK